jgi:hypothetical protein
MGIEGRQYSMLSYGAERFFHFFQLWTYSQFVKSAPGSCSSPQFLVSDSGIRYLKMMTAVFHTGELIETPVFSTERKGLKLSAGCLLRQIGMKFASL